MFLNSEFLIKKYERIFGSLVFIMIKKFKFYFSLTKFCFHMISKKLNMKKITTLMVLIATIESTCYNYDNGDTYPNLNTSYCCKSLIMKQASFNGQYQIRRL